jgi:AAA+ superfamily predicted ATPase
LEAIGVGGTFDITPRCGGLREKKQRFLVEEMAPQQDKSLLIPYVFTPSSEITIKTLTQQPKSQEMAVIDIQFKGLFGLDAQLDNIKLCIGGSFASGEPTRPILILGSKYTGKTSVLKQVKAAKWNKVLHIGRSDITGGETKVTTRLETIFRDAQEFAPSLITIDNLHKLANKENQTSVPETLETLIIDSCDHGVQVLATAKRTIDIEPDLCDAFTKKIELPLPTLKARRQILTAKKL